MTIYSQKQMARKCGCITCNTLLYNIKSSLQWFTTAKDKHNKLWARTNYHYFIKSLLESNVDPRLCHAFQQSVHLTGGTVAPVELNPETELVAPADTALAASR